MGLDGLGALRAETGVLGYPPKQCVRAPAKNGRSRANGSRRRRRLRSECGVVNCVLMEQPAPFSAAKRPQRASLALGPLWERTAVIPMRHPPVEPQDGRWDLSAAENRPLADGCWGIWVPPTTVERHVTGLEMLNLPGEPCGDWRGHGVWLSRNFADDMGRRLCVTLSGTGPLSVHALLGAQGVSDIRPRLALAGHPAAQRSVPVWGASYARAALEWAWDALEDIAEGKQRDGSELAEWLSCEQSSELEGMARQLAQTHPCKSSASAWMRWVEQSLDPPGRRGAAAVGPRHRPLDLPPRITKVIA